MNHADKVNDKLKESKLKKPEVMTKRKANVEEDERPRKRIRPLLQRETSIETTSNNLTSGPSEVRTDAAAPVPVFQGPRADSFRLLPSLKVDKSAVYNFNFGLFKATVTVSNFAAAFGAGCSIHKVS